MRPSQPPGPDAEPGPQRGPHVPAGARWRRRPARGRIVPAVALLAIAVAGCAGGDGRTRAREAAERAAPAGTVYTSDQLQQALLTEISGYRRAGEPDSGEYGTLKAIRNFNQLQRQVTLDKPQCATAAGGGLGAAQQTVPAALATFARGNGQSITETLMAVPSSVALRQVRVRVPADCWTFRARVGGRSSAHQIVEAGPGDIGQGSRTVGVATRSGGSHVKTWYVLLRGRGYLATITLYGANATRAEAEQLARQSYDQAERILP